MGPSPFLGLPETEFKLIVIGWGLIGVAQAFIYIPIMPEIIESMQVKYKIVTGENEYIDHKLNDKASGIYTTFYSLGEILAPNVGSILYSYIGYRRTCEVLALTALIYALVYFILNVGLNVFEKERKHK